MKSKRGFTLYGSPVKKLAKPSFHGMTALNKSKSKRGFTLIELLVAMSIIALISSVVFASLSTARRKARDSQRIQTARQIALALELYEHTNNSYKVSGAGLATNNGTGYAAIGDEDGYSTSILSALKSQGYMQSSTLNDPVFGLENFYIGLCTSTNAYNVFVKLEQEEYNKATSTIANSCGGQEAASEGFSFIGATTGGTSASISTLTSQSEGGGGLVGAYEVGMGSTGGGGEGDPSCTGTIAGSDGLTYGLIVAEDNKCWLDRNLGALQAAVSYSDYLSYGDWYQWGRAADGHQKITYTGPTTCTPVNGKTPIISVGDTPPNALFITTSTTPMDWRITQNDGLWNKDTNLNDPCPNGFHVPLYSEWLNWLNNVTGTSTCASLNNCREILADSKLRLPSPGGRNSTGNTYFSLSSTAFYWSSNVSGIRVSAISWGMTIQPTTKYNRAHGFSVRCIKD